MNRPLVSIGIPTYNRPDLLKRALKCALGQSYSNLEIIVSDNCSDNYDFNRIIDEFSFDKRIHFNRMKTNTNAIENFRAVKDQSSGDYFMWLADDDWLDSDYIEKCLNFFIKNKGYSFVGGRSRYYNEHNEFEFDGEIFNKLDHIFRVNRIIKYYSTVTYNSIFYSLIKREYLDFIENRHRLADDWVMIQDLLIHGKGKQLADINVHRLNNGASKDFKSLKKALGIKELTENNYSEYIYNVVIESLNRDKIKQNLRPSEFRYLTKKLRDVIFRKWPKD